jgi:hypothetical protein
MTSATPHDRSNVSGYWKKKHSSGGKQKKTENKKEILTRYFPVLSKILQNKDISSNPCRMIAAFVELPNSNPSQIPKKQSFRE